MAIKLTSEMTRDELVAEAVTNSIKVARTPHSSGRILSKALIEHKPNAWLSRFINTSRGILKGKKKQVSLSACN